jgi:hydrogenase nickel incorporation protein HypA/HybF
VHEYSIANGIYRTVLAIAEAHTLQSVTAVRLSIGLLAGVSVEALEYSWTFICAGDPRTQQAKLDITIIDGVGNCARCGFAGIVTTALRICPVCGAPGLRFSAGEELMLTEVSGEPLVDTAPAGA